MIRNKPTPHRYQKGNTVAQRYDENDIKYLLIKALMYLKNNETLRLNELIENANLGTYPLYFNRLKKRYVGTSTVRIKELPIPDALEFCLSDKATNYERLFLIYKILQTNVLNKLSECVDYKQRHKLTNILRPYKMQKCKIFKLKSYKYEPNYSINASW